METIDALLAGVLEGTQVPSLAAAVIVDGKLHAAGTVGVRKRGDDTPVTVDDKYHIGSCTKAMTATLAGILVERGLVSWDSSIKSVFPEMVVHPGYETVTLKQLLTHTGGFPANPHDALWEAIWEAEEPPREQRVNLVLPGLLSQAPDHDASEFLYSNAGYTVAGAMLERVTDTPFETLLVQEYLQLLGMTSAGFGAPATQGEVDQPYGHDPEPVDPEPYGDNPPATAPAGTVHMSILDFAKHAIFHLTGEPKLLSREMLELLHTPLKDDYAMGWSVGERKWAGGVGINHAGSNTTFHALVGVAPLKNKALVCASNLGTEEGANACIGLFQTLTKRYLQE